MKKSYALIAVVAIVAVAVLYSQGYFSTSITTQASITVEKGWSTVVIPDSWPETTASALVGANPIIGMVSYWSSDHWTSYVSGSGTPDITITPGMELKLWTTASGSIVSPEA